MIAADLLLLLLDDAGTPESAAIDAAVASGVLADLGLAGRIRLTPDGHPDGAGRIEVLDTEPLGVAVLDDALSAVSAAGRTRNPDLITAIRAMGPDVTHRVAGTLVEEGSLVVHQPRVLSGLRQNRYTARDTRHEEELRARLRSILLGDRTAQPAEAMVIGLVHASDATLHVFGPDLPELSRRELGERTTPFTDGTWGAGAVSADLTGLSFALTSTMMTSTLIVNTIL